MKKLFITIMLSGMLGLLNSPAIAGPGHEHKDGGHGHSHGPVSEKKVIHKAVHRLKKLVKKGKIDKSWQAIKPTSTEKKTYNGQEEWVVVFKNPNLSDESKQTLYMFFKLNGHYLATNYTGK